MNDNTNSKMLFLGHIPPPNHGAAIVGEKVFSIVSEIYDCHFIRVSNTKSINDIGNVNGLFDKVKFVLSLYCKIFLFLIKKRPTVIYLTPSLNGFAFLRDFPILLLLYIYKVIINSRVICHIHMRPLFLIRYNIFMRLWCFFSKKFEIILLSKNLINDYIDSFLPQKIYYLANTSQLDFRKSTLIGSSKSVIYVGHIMESKGALRLLQLVEKFLECDVVFHFAGEFGSDYDKIKFNTLLNKLPKGKVYYHGAVSGVDKINLFNTADLLVLPSYSEAQPLTIIEAFSCGLPVVATPTGGVVDMLDNATGRCVEFEFFESAIHEVLKLGKPSFRQQCIDKYNDCYDESKFILECLRIFKSS